MASLVFIPNLAKEYGASNFTVGLIVGAYGAMLFTAYYVFGRASDMYGRRIILRAGLLASAIAFLLQLTADNARTLLFARALAGFAYGIAPAALIAYIYESKKSVGRFSSYGSLGWMIGSLAAGVIASYHKIFILSSLLMFIAFLISIKMPSAGSQRIHVPVFPVDLMRKNSDIYIPYFLRHLGASIAWTILPLYLVGLGASFFWVGFMHTINAGTQFMVMRRIDGVDDRKLIAWGLSLSCIVFFSYSLARNFLQVIPIQVMLGFAWSFLYVGSLKSLLEKNVERATASGLLNSTINLGGIAGPIAAGAVTAVYSFRVAMVLASLMCFAALAYRILVSRTGFKAVP